MTGLYSVDREGLAVNMPDLAAIDAHVSPRREGKTVHRDHTETCPPPPAPAPGTPAGPRPDPGELREVHAVRWRELRAETAAVLCTVQADDFTARLFNIYKQMVTEGRSSPIVLGINRSDYMLDESEDQGCHLKQTEINTFAVAAFGTNDMMSSMHR
ncbi:unnamed protein product [Merluccius merluccius]